MKQFLRSLFFASLLLVNINCFVHAQGNAVPEEQIFKELEVLRSGLEKGVQNKDIDSLLSFTHPDVIVTWQNGEVSHGQGEVKKFFEKTLLSPDSVLSKIVMKPIVTEGRKIIGNTIISYGTMEEEYFFRDKSLHFTLNSRFSAWLTKEDDKLLLRGLHLSAGVFDNPVQDLYVTKARWMFGVGGLLVGFLVGCALCKIFRCRKGR